MRARAWTNGREKEPDTQCSKRGKHEAAVGYDCGCGYGRGCACAFAFCAYRSAVSLSVETVKGATNQSPGHGPTEGRRKGHDTQVETGGEARLLGT